MTLLEHNSFKDYLNTIPSNSGNFQATTQQKNSNVTKYFDSIYSYPPKFKIKWDALDELKGDLFLDYNYGVLEHSLPGIDILEDWFFNEKPTEAVNESYTVKQYINGYFNKINSSDYYSKKTKVLQEALKNVPVFIIQNGNGEIVLNKPSNNLQNQNGNSYFKEKVYDFCGAFDSQVEKRQQLGFFFMSLVDAENYLKAIAQNDIDGIKTLGLSIHCVGLDFAYKVTREHHPGIDFRFVPDLEEVQSLLAKYINKSDVIVEDEQQQLRFRPRAVNLFPYLGKLGTVISPSSSFLQRNEYFKGVPIYIVQISHKPRNIIFEQYYKTIGTLDTAYGKAIQSLDSIIGFGHNWIMQGSLQDAGNSEKFTNFIFFDKTQAAQFVKKQGRNVARYSGSHAPELASIIRKPKIFVYNLEDFLESWEDSNSAELATNNTSLPQTIYKTHATHFVSPPQIQNEVLEIKQNIKENAFNGVINGFGLKLRTLKRTLEIFFSIY